MKSDITGIILAGGKSRRMGEDKAFVSFSGRPLIETLIDKLSGVFKDLIIVTNTPHLYKGYGLETYTDLVKDKGPLAGIYTGLFYSKTAHSFIVACDMPFLNRDLIRFMLGKIDRYDIVVSRRRGRPEPLCAVYSKRCIKPIECQLHNNNLKITDLFPRVRTRIITAEETASCGARDKDFVNINTREDYRAICKGS